MLALFVPFVIMALVVPLVVTFTLLDTGPISAIVYLSKMLNCPLAVAQMAVIVPCHDSYPLSLESVNPSFCLRTIPALAIAGVAPKLIVIISAALVLMFLMK
jgi:hypothetical protein